MKIRDFGLEIFFGRYEFSAPYLLAQSDCESLSIRELLALEPGAQEDFLDTWLGYSENDGAPALREAVSGLYTQCGPENVLLHVGAQEAIFGALNVLVEPGEHVICQFPTYQSCTRWRGPRAASSPSGLCIRARTAGIATLTSWSGSSRPGHACWC